MAKNGLLIHYEFCTGCHTCEVACKKEHGLETGQFGIKALQYGPVEYAKEKWDLLFIPTPTSLCDLCKDRVAEGKDPTCVHHCMSKVMEYGPLDELIKSAEDKEKVVVFVPTK